MVSRSHYHKTSVVLLFLCLSLSKYVTFPLSVSQGSTIRKRKLYESFLEKVSILGESYRNSGHLNYIVP